MKINCDTNEISISYTESNKIFPVTSVRIIRQKSVAVSSTKIDLSRNLITLGAGGASFPFHRNFYWRLFRHLPFFLWPPSPDAYFEPFEPRSSSVTVRETIWLTRRFGNRPFVRFNYCIISDFVYHCRGRNLYCTIRFDCDYFAIAIALFYLDDKNPNPAAQTNIPN